MSKPGPVFAWGSVSEDLALFKALTPEQRFKTFDAMVRQDLVRGEILVAQGDPADSLYIVLHGALAVRRTGDSQPIAELRAGELVGEIGFFANPSHCSEIPPLPPLGRDIARRRARLAITSCHRSGNRR